MKNELTTKETYREVGQVIETRKALKAIGQVPFQPLRKKRARRPEIVQRDRLVVKRYQSGYKIKDIVKIFDLCSTYRVYQILKASGLSSNRNDISR
jgi:hypothetical protein